MRLPDFDQLRAGGPDCPSDFTLDRLQARELEPAKAQPLEQHIAGCDQCSARMAERNAGFDAISEVDPRRMLAKIRAAVDEPQPTSLLDRLAAFGRRALAPLALTAAVASVAIVVTRHGDVAPNDGAPSVTRAKGGGAILHVLRQVGDHAEAVTSGDAFHPGDRIRFSVDLQDEGDVSVVGIEASGALYTAWPLEPGTSTHLQAGQKLELPGAVSLDDSTGKETLYLAYCPTGIGAPHCTSAGRDHEPVCQPGCKTTPFVLEKKP